MTKNPWINALAASTYITIVGTFMSWATRLFPGPDTFVAPIAMMSLFTLSAAVMGYCFCFTPLTLYLDGKKKQAATLFVQTVGVFGILTIVAFGLLFAGAGR